MTLRLALAAVLLGVVTPWAAAGSPLPAEAWRADLAQFRSGFFALDRAYTPEARRQAERRLQALEAASGAMDDLRFSLALAQVVALADNGHSWLFGAPRMARSNRIGLRLLPFGEAFVVLRARDAEADLLGARLVAIDGVPLARLREAAHSLTGGLATWRDLQAPLLLESPEQLHALGLATAPAAAVYTFATDDGRRVDRRLEGEPPQPGRPHADPHRLLLPGAAPAADDGGGWRGLLPAAAVPWSLREPAQPLRWRPAPEIDALVVEMRQTYSSARASLPAFFDDVRRAVQLHRPRHLVLDLRLNGGGDLTQARDFAESLPTLARGSVFVLTSPATFSAAISITAYLKQRAPGRVRIVGETVGDRLEFFAEGRPTTLPHSGQVVLPATERHDYRDGCRRFDDCHAPVRQRPIAVSGLDPDIPAPWTVDAYRQGRDPAMEAVAEALRRGASGGD